MAEAFFLRDGNSFVPTELTRGPWDPKAQHGGPPAALLASALEGCERREDMMMVRMTFEILKPIPLVPLTASAKLQRGGRSVHLVAGTLSAGGEEVLRAQAVRIRVTDIDVPEPPSTQLAGPEAGNAPRYFRPVNETGYHTAMEVSFIRGNFDELGPAMVWMRMRVPLIAGEPITPLSRALVAADSGNGVSSSLEYRRFIFVNPDLTVYLHRYPVGEWICLEAETTATRRGVGLAVSTISDLHGPVGRGLQSLFIAARSSE